MSTMLNTYEEKPLLPSQMAERYAELCALRDKVNAVNVPVEAELTNANAIAERARLEAERLAGIIDDNRGRAKWLALKREIRVLAKALSGKLG